MSTDQKNAWDFCYEYGADGTWSTYRLPEFEGMPEDVRNEKYESFMDSIGFTNYTELNTDFDDWKCSMWEHETHGRLITVSGHDAFFGHVVCKSPPALLRFMADFGALFPAMNTAGALQEVIATANRTLFDEWDGLAIVQRIREREVKRRQMQRAAAAKAAKASGSG